MNNFILNCNDHKNVFELYPSENFDSFRLVVANSNFSGSSTSYFEADIKKFFKDLEILINSKEIKSVEIFDTESDDSVKFNKLDLLGHYSVSVKIGGSHRSSYAKISFDFDQTAFIGSLIDIKQYA